MRNLIYHIYWGTSGNSGLYLDQIYRTLDENLFKQKAFVNYYYPFPYGKRIFFKRGDVAYSKYKGKIRKVFQLLEIIKGYVIILFNALKDKPQVINYSHVGQSYFFVVWFLKLLKLTTKAKIVITCHDVRPHYVIKGEMANRNKIFNLADFLVVHNNDSKKDLQELFGVQKGKILHHLFPIMDLSTLSNCYGENPCDKVDFLFIGHLRKDKGIELLLNAWRKFHSINKYATLRIAGRHLPDIKIDRMEFEHYNVDFNLNYISDDDYYWYVKSARYVVLPYIQGTNSGIISTVLSLGTDVITSDIPMFSENPLVPNENMFITGDAESLVNKLQEKYFDNKSCSTTKLTEYTEQFRKEVVEVYNTLTQDI
jgi:glycosyltransferase involved in cell wall biosynthesis